MRIKDLIKEIHQNAKEKGFWDKPREVGTLLMLIISELAEALEADRKDNRSPKDLNGFDDLGQCGFDGKFRNYIKDTFEDELADVAIRLFDLCGGLNIDLEKHIEIKMSYNKRREKLHGKRY